MSIRLWCMIAVIATILFGGYVRGIIPQIQKWNVVENTTDPSLGEKRVELEEEKTFALSEHMAVGINCIEIDKNEMIYILNARLNEIVIVSLKGSVRKSIRVPREVMGFKVRGGNIHIFGNNCIYLSDINGQILKSIQIPEGLISAIPIRDGKYIAMTSPRRNENEIVLYDAEGKRESIYYRHQIDRPKPVFIKSSKNENYYYTGTDHEYSYHQFFCESDEGKANFCDSGEYVLKTWDEQGNNDKEIRKTEKAEKISKEERESVIKKMERGKTGLLGGNLSRNDITKGLYIPPHKPYFHMVFGDVDGKIYTVKVNINQTMTIDVFDKNGKYIEKIHMEIFPIKKIYQGKIYGISKSTPNALARYRMRVVQ